MSTEVVCVCMCVYKQGASESMCLCKRGMIGDICASNASLKVHVCLCNKQPSKHGYACMCVSYIFIPVDTFVCECTYVCVHVCMQICMYALCMLTPPN